MSLVKRSTYGVEKSAKSEIGGGLALLGVGGLGIGFVAAFLPFITFPILCVLLVVGGLALKL